MGKVEKKIDKMGFFNKLAKGRKFRDITDLGITDVERKDIEKLIRTKIKNKGTSFARGFGNFRKNR